MLECIYFFVIGAFAGWMLECVFKFATRNFVRTPGILNTPFCILYGLGTLVLSTVVNKLSNNIWATFILSMIVLTIMEYITFVLLDKMYNVRLWDYSDMTFNMGEKICLEFSLVWGALGALYIKYLLPVFTALYVKAQGAALTMSLILILSIIIVDFVYSTYYLTKRKNTLSKESAEVTY